MFFAKQLRDLVRSGEIMTSVRIWMHPRVKVGGLYALPPGWIVIESLVEIGIEDISDEMAIESGFGSVAELLATARHGRGERVFLVRFRYQDSI